MQREFIEHGGTVTDSGGYRTSIEIATFAQRDEKFRIEDVLVDPDTMFAWLPSEMLAEAGIVSVESERFEVADGQIIERPIGHALITAAGETAPTLVVFAALGDKIRLGAHALSGMRLRLDLERRELVPSGPVITAVAA